jgi:hypothetical protein
MQRQRCKRLERIFIVEEKNMFPKRERLLVAL